MNRNFLFIDIHEHGMPQGIDFILMDYAGHAVTNFGNPPNGRFFAICITDNNFSSHDRGGGIIFKVVVRHALSPRLYLSSSGGRTRTFNQRINNPRLCLIELRQIEQPQTVSIRLPRLERTIT